MSRIFFALAAFAAVSSAPAFASPLPVETRIVAYGDLDLSTRAGQARLEQRIVSAVREVCGEANRYDLRGRAAVRDCRETTLARIVRPNVSPVQAGTR